MDLHLLSPWSDQVGLLDANSRGPGLGPPPESVLVIGLAEAPPPQQSLIWTVLDGATAEIGSRLDLSGLRIRRPEVLKLRFLTPHLASLMRESRRAALVTGISEGGGPDAIVHRYHPPSGTIVPPPSAPFEKGLVSSPPGVSQEIPFATPPPAKWIRAGSPTPSSALPNAGDLSQLSFWLEGDLPLGGLDLLGIPLPPPDAPGYSLLQMDPWLPEATQRVTGILWQIVLEVGGEQGAEKAA